MSNLEHQNGAVCVDAHRATQLAYAFGPGSMTAHNKPAEGSGQKLGKRPLRRLMHEEEMWGTGE